MAIDTETLHRLLGELEKALEPIEEEDILKVLTKELSQNPDHSIPMEWNAEWLAFNLFANPQESESRWGTYFGPKIIWKNKEDGEEIEFPSKKDLTPEIVSYWESRAIETIHPWFKARYADLVFDLSKLTMKKPDYKMGFMLIDNILETYGKNLYKPEISIPRRLDRALRVSMFLGDKGRIERVRDAIISFEDRFAKDEMLGTWGFSFDLLLENKKVALTQELEAKIIGDLESRLKRLIGFSDQPEAVGFSSIWAIQAVVTRLADYYRRSNSKDDVQRVVRIYGDAIEKNSEKMSALQKSGWLRTLYFYYLEYELREEAEKVAVKLRELGPEINNGMGVIHESMEIPVEEVNNHVKMLIDDGLEIAFIRIAQYYSPDKEEMAKQIIDISKEAPFLSLLTTSIHDYSGRQVATVGPIEKDLTGNIVYYLSRDMSTIHAFYLRKVMSALIEKYNLSSQHFVDFLTQSPLFSGEKRLILEKGFDAYLTGNSIAAIHLLVPQVEDAIRNLVEKTGGAVLKPSRNGDGFQLKVFDELLRDPRVESVLGENGAFYFRVLFTDQRGWNLRNNVCHGITPAKALDISVADRLVHALLRLAIVRENKKEL